LKAPAAKPMHTGTLGKTSRGGVNRSYFRDPPSGSSGGLVSLPDGVLSPQTMGCVSPSRMVGPNAVKKAFTKGL
jgi:hypothetical protein